jgi:hypothetical protein
VPSYHQNNGEQSQYVLVSYNYLVFTANNDKKGKKQFHTTWIYNYKKKLEEKIADFQNDEMIRKIILQHH